MKIYFATTNAHKFSEVSALASRFGISLGMVEVELVEPQADSLREIVRAKVRQAYLAVKKPVIADDSGLFIPALRGFPGPYSSFVMKTVGNEGILRLLEGKDRGAEFVCAAGYFDGREEVVVEGKVAGKIADSVRGRGGFGFDPIFIPCGYEKTFAEDPETKQKLSHRAVAFTSLFQKLVSSRI